MAITVDPSIMDDPKNKAKIDQMRNKLGYKPPALVMSRVPKKTLDRFFQLCTEEAFCSDRGMLLKYLIDFHDGIIPSGIEHLEIQIEALNYEVTQLKSKEIEDKAKIKRRRTLSGREIKGIGEQNGNIK